MVGDISGLPMTHPDESHDWWLPAVHGLYAEREALSPQARLRVWSYTDRLSYRAGDRVQLHVNTNATRFAVRVWRDGAEPREVYRRADLPGSWRDTPAGCSWSGCGWPPSLTIDIGADWPSGAYVVTTCALDGAGVVADSHDHLFILAPAEAKPKAGRLLLLAATGSWTAYNDWGGSNHYQGTWGPDGDRFAPVLSLERPFAKGFVTLPPDAPRAVLRHAPPPMSEPRYPHMEWAWKNGYSKKYMSSSWAGFERHFMVWAERAGYAVDLASHVDLHYRPEILDGYSTLVMVGHDEYWTWEMRDAVEAFAERGGGVARFAGNFLWQVRLEDEGRRQVCYKYLVAEDPVLATDRRHLATGAWDSPLIGRPGADTFGLNATRGTYAGWGGAAPRGARGFPIYRPDHWAFAETGLYYGDILGAESAIFGYEVDGLDYVIKGGLPFPEHVDRVPAGLEILGLGLAFSGEEGPTITEGRAFLGRWDMRENAMMRTGRGDDAAIEATKRGCGCIVAFSRGKGEVFHAGTCDWVAGLQREDAMVEQVTHNVLRRFLARGGAPR